MGFSSPGQEDVTETGSRFGEADRTELARFQQNPGNLGKELSPLVCVRRWR